jgi:hypothetical protein
LGVRDAPTVEGISFPFLARDSQEIAVGFEEIAVAAENFCGYCNFS